MTTATSRRKSILVILRRAYLEITNNHCAAKLIEYFKHWREWKIQTQRSEWVYMPFKWIYEDLMGEHSIHVIRKAIALLLERNILSHRHNPDNGQDKTWQYRLNEDVLEQLLTKHRECNCAHSSVKAEQTYTQNQLTNTTATTNAVVSKPEEKATKTTVPAIPELANNCPTPSATALASAADNAATPGQELLTQLPAAGIPLSPQLRLLVQSHTVESVKAALAYTHYQVKQGKVQDAAAYFVSAVKGGWRLPAVVRESKQLQLFNQWFNLAKAQGLVKYSQQEGSEIWVSADGVQWQQFEVALQTYPLEQLQAKAAVDNTIVGFECLPSLVTGL